MAEETAHQIDSPIALLPDLTMWGIEEVDKGVCEDTAENRRIIREMKSRYQPVYAGDGSPTNLIQVITPEMRQAALGANRSIILTDDRNKDSDYLTGINLVIEPASDHIVPAWVLAATRHWLTVADKRREPGFADYRPALIGPPRRCSAIKIDGHRCANWTNGTVDYGDFCRTHLANRPNGSTEDAGHLARARNRIQSAASAAVDELEALLATATGEGVRLNAAKEILDRAGIRGGVEVESKVTITVDAAAEVRKRLERLRKGAEAKEELEARIYGEADIQKGEPIEEAVIVE